MLRRSGRAVAASSFVGLALAGAAGCKGGHGAIGGLRDGLARGDAVSIGSATRDAPTCGAVEAGKGAPRECLDAIASWLGSKSGFQTTPPDQAAAATAAVVITRGGHGEWLPSADAWLVALRTGTGAGADTLRLAVAAQIAEKAGPLARALESDDDARALLRAVASAVPGACETYARLGAGDEPTAGPPEKTADHSACVQRASSGRRGRRSTGGTAPDCGEARRERSRSCRTRGPRCGRGRRRRTLTCARRWTRAWRG